MAQTQLAYTGSAIDVSGKLSQKLFGEGVVTTPPQNTESTAAPGKQAQQSGSKASDYPRVSLLVIRTPCIDGSRVSEYRAGVVYRNDLVKLRHADNFMELDPEVAWSCFGSSPVYQYADDAMAAAQQLDPTRVPHNYMRDKPLCVRVWHFLTPFPDQPR